jgi:hypothetical protein
MANQFTTKSGYQGDMLIAYRGFCKNCGAEKRIYYANCNDEMQRLCLDYEEFMRYKGTCEACYIDKGHKGTVNFEARLPWSQADKDLAILNKGLKLDKSVIGENEKEIKENDIWLNNQELKVEEYKKYLKKL